MFPGHTQILEPRVLCAAHLIGTYTFHPSVNAPVGHDVAIQPDGKIVAVGTTSRATTDALVVRYDTNGNPDNSFGIAGLTTLDTGGNDLACAMALQPDGKIVVAGETTRGRRVVILLARLNPDGSPDPHFGKNGVVTYAASSRGSRARDVAVSNDSRIVITGSIGDNVMVARFNSDGTLDSSFSTDGINTQDFGGTEIGNAIVATPDGRITVAGTGDGGAGGSDILLLRYNANGTLDNRFSRDGKMMLDYDDGLDRGNAVLVDSAGRIVVGGGVGSKKLRNLAVARISASGRIDRSFGNKGWVLGKGVRGDVLSLANAGGGRVEADGSGASGGTVMRVSATGKAKAAAYPTRVNATAIGTGRVARAVPADLVSAYVTGDNLIEYTPASKFSPESGSTPLIQSDGKFIIAVQRGDGVMLERLNPDGTIDDSFGLDYSTLLNAGIDDRIIFTGDVLDQLSDGSFYLSGTLRTSRHLSAGMFAVKFLANGKIDRAFGTNGFVTFSATDDFFLSQALPQPDGSLVMVGSETTFFPGLGKISSTGKTDFYYSEYAFPKLFDNFDIPVSPQDFMKVSVGGDGRMLLTGPFRDGSGEYQMMLNGDGTIDSSFGDKGIRATYPGGPQYELLGDLQPDNSFLSFTNTNSQYKLTKRRPDTSLDPMFGANGVSILALPTNFAFDRLKILSNGKILLIGTSGTAKSATVDVIRLNSNGSLDTTFGDGDGIEAYPAKAGSRISNVQIDATRLILTVNPDPYSGAAATDLLVQFDL